MFDKSLKVAIFLGNVQGVTLLKPRIDLACHQHGSASPKGFYSGRFERSFYARRDILPEKHLLTHKICQNQCDFNNEAE